MNIEDERKAFEAVLPVPLYVHWNAEFGRYMTTLNHFICLSYQGAYTGWLAAKAQAEEMAKPQAIATCDYDGERMSRTTFQ